MCPDGSVAGLQTPLPPQRQTHEPRCDPGEVQPKDYTEQTSLSLPPHAGPEEDAPELWARWEYAAPWCQKCQFITY